MYEAWLDSKKHGEMVAGNAKIDPKVGGKFSIWDGAIRGQTLELYPDQNRIVQSWRYDYDDWPIDSPSKITIEFLPYKNDQCKLNFRQSAVPSKYAEEIAQGWRQYYWEPMKKYFAG